MEGNEKKKNRKPLIALLVVAILGIIGGTFAYFTSSDTFTNVFSTKPYHVEVVETFQSPTDWTPGTTTAKTIVATNKGDIDAAVRIHYTESWTDSTNNALSLKDGNDQSAAIINFVGVGSNWIQSTEGGVNYYYYKNKIAKNQSTPSLISGVTFNPAVTISSSHNCVDNDTAHTKTCTTTTSGYAGGTYTLTFYVETVQFDQYQTAWSTSVPIE